MNNEFDDGADEWNYYIDLKTAGYHQAIVEMHKELVKYAFTSFACAKIYNKCPTAFFKKGN